MARKAASSSNTCESFAALDPASSSWKTCLPSGVAASIVYSKSWPRAGIMLNGTAFLQAPLAPLTKGTASSSLLPTPSASSYGSNQGGAGGRTGKVRESLETMARNGRLLPTPTCDRATYHRRHGGLVAGGYLHPRFVEWMMGAPPGWTDLDGDDDPKLTQPDSKLSETL